MTIEVTPAKPLIGAIVHVDRSRLLTEEVAKACLDLLEERGVVVFPTYQRERRRTTCVYRSPRYPREFHAQRARR